MIGKDRLNLAIDPLPDLAIEVDVTSQTQVEAYTRFMGLWGGSANN